MTHKSIISIVLGSAIALSGLSVLLPVNAQARVRFICEQVKDQKTNQSFYSTNIWVPRGKIALIRWENQNLGGYSPQQRCQAVSPRFQEAYNNGTINMITNGRVNGQAVICTSRAYGQSCETLLLTLRPTDNERQVLNQIIQIFNGVQAGPVRHRSGNPQIYYKINFEEFIENAPVATEN